MKAIALVPARCGSRSIPLKNIKQFCGKPLLFWSLKALQQATHVEKVYVATDCVSIKDVALSFGFSKVEVYDRLAENAQDTSSTEALMLEFIEAIGIPDEKHLILVQATTPYTNAADIDAAADLYIAERADSLLTCALAKKFIWDRAGYSVNYDYRNRPRRQNFEGTLVENGAFYISQVAAIKASRNRLSGRIAIHEMPDFTLTELDEPADWAIAEELMRRYRIKPKSKASEIRLFLSDIDGVMTDGGMYYSEKGDELKKFSTYDGKAIEILRNKGVLTGLITSEVTALNSKRAQKLKVDWLCQGAVDKLPLVQAFCEKQGIQLSEVAYIGDDLGDMELLKSVGVAACPLNARSEVRAIEGIKQLETKGGDGALREFCEYLIRENP